MYRSAIGRQVWNSTKWHPIVYKRPFSVRNVSRKLLKRPLSYSLVRTNNVTSQPKDTASQQSSASTEDESIVKKVREEVMSEVRNLEDELMRSSETLYTGTKGKDEGADESVPATRELEVASNEEEYPDRYYFDTQKIYNGLKYAGFTDGQADTVMLTITDFMLKGLEEVKEHSIPQWAAENEAYLFEAACSEIRNDIQTSRQDQAEQYRSGLARVQRDLEALQHEANEIIQQLKTDLEMEINDRKDATRTEENKIHLEIQELNNKIITDINSDAKSDIEALRWQTTRRGLTGIIIVAGCILLATIKGKDKEKKPVRREAVKLGEYRVPVLHDSEIDEPDEIKPVEVLK